jgi:hypothetical protein
MEFDCSVVAIWARLLDPLDGSLDEFLARDIQRVIGILCKSGSKERICVDSNTQYTKF